MISDGIVYSIRRVDELIFLVSVAKIFFSLLFYIYDVILSFPVNQSIYYFTEIDLNSWSLPESLCLKLTPKKTHIPTVKNSQCWLIQTYIRIFRDSFS